MIDSRDADALNYNLNSRIHREIRQKTVSSICGGRSISNLSQIYCKRLAGTTITHFDRFRHVTDLIKLLPVGRPVHGTIMAFA